MAQGRRGRRHGQRLKEAALVRAGTPTPLPTGTVTFVLADVEGSVRLWESQPQAMAAATARFDALVADLVDTHRGVRPVEQGEGDSFVAAFPVARDALAFALAVQRALLAAAWATSLLFRLRMAAHTGASQLRDDDNYMGPTVNRCARLRALAHGGQVLFSGTTSALVADELPAGVTLIDLGQHRLRDFDRAEHVFQLAHPELPGQFPPLHDDGLGRRRLPTALSTFVARTDEMQAVDELLRRERLVTLIGAGGSGKTRLALECARRQHDRFADGAAWADAAPIADGALVSSCVAGALDIREVPAEPLLDTIVREVGNREVLLVIDNCEHVIDDAAQLVARLLGQCPRLRILSTSREPLGVPGETSMRVPSLDHVDALQLFVDRARAVRGDFRVSPETEPAVVDICRRLDGIPLAIELAAARIRVLTPQQIADGLADRFRLLTGGSRTALPRQRTLEASVDWSYRMLSEGERVLFDRLSMFAGGFTLDATRRVCTDDVVPEEAVLDLLTALLDKSLVQVEGEGSGAEVRYRMLETIRHFARQRLADTVDAEVMRDRHLGYFLELAEQIGPRIEQGDEITWLDRLEDDVDNLRAALDWADQRGKSSLLLRLAGSLWLFWEVRCRFDEGCAWLHTALAAETEPTVGRATALYGLGDMSLFTLEIEQVVAAGEEVVAIGKHLGDPSVIARGTTLLGWGACFGAYHDAAWAVDALGEMLEELREHDNPWLHCDASLARGLACTNAGDLRAAGPAFDKALASAVRWRSVGGIQRSLYFRGLAHVLAGEVDEGEPLLMRAIDLADDLDDTFFRALSLAAIGYARYLRGDLAAAEAASREALALGERYRNQIGIAFAALALAFVLAARGDDGAAWSLLEAPSPLADTMAFSWVNALLEGTSALIEARRGEIGAARARLDAIARVVSARPQGRGSVALYRGWIDRLAGDDDAAESAFTEAVGSSAAAGARADAAAALHQLGVSAARREQYERAARLFAAADAERARLHVAPVHLAGVTEGDAELATTRAALGEGAFASETAAGAAITLDEAVRFALESRGGHRRPTWGWDSLTPSELEVVRLVSEGLSNPAIADKLMITRGMVKAHLSHVFTKLGVASRAELAAEAARRTPG